MEQHPVPQNVTTFQFRLIGDMTLKQFGYLTGGFILGYITYKIPLPFFFTWPVAGTFALGGIGFAFIPVEERPMDVWFLSFVKSIYSPTQYVWQKTAPLADPVPGEITAKKASVDNPLAFITQSANAITDQLLKLLPQPKAKKTVVPQATTAAPMTPVVQPLSTPIVSNQTVAVPVTPVEKTVAPVQAISTPTPTPIPKAIQEHKTPHASPKIHIGLFDWIGDLFTPKQKMNMAPAVAPSYPLVYPNILPGSIQTSVTGTRLNLSTPPVTENAQKPTTSTPAPIPEINSVDADKKAHDLAEQTAKLQSEIHTQNLSNERILELQQQLTEIMTQRNHMEEELHTLRQKLTEQPAQQTTYKTANTSQSEEPERATVTVITADTAVKAGLPRITNYPNVVTGIIKDNENNLLPGVLITVRDKDEIPVRALKTNKLGQFAASTPLSNGVFTVDIEDPKEQYVFDRIRITLTGAVVAPMEVVAKSKKQIHREKLAKEIFGGNQNT